MMNTTELLDDVNLKLQTVAEKLKKVADNCRKVFDTGYGTGFIQSGGEISADKSVWEITSIDPTYENTSALPTEGVADGTTYIVLGDEASIYSWNAGKSEWKYVDDIRENTLYIDMTSGYLYRFDRVAEAFVEVSVEEAAMAESNAKGYADNQASNALTEAKAYTDEKASAAESNAKSYADNQASNALTEAKAYTDEKASASDDGVNQDYVDAQDAATLASAKAHANAKASDALASAKAYADGKIGNVSSTTGTMTILLNAGNEGYTGTTTVTIPGYVYKIEASASVGTVEVSKVDNGEIKSAVSLSAVAYTRSSTITFYAEHTAKASVKVSYTAYYLG